MTEPIDALKELLAIDVGNAIRQLGFIPDEYGDAIKEVFKLDHFPLICATGLALEDCVRNKSWDGLKKIPMWVAKTKEGKPPWH